MSGAALALHQFRLDQKSFWRNPGAVFFTVALPLVFLFIFATIFGNDRLDELGDVKTTTYYIPAILTLAVVSATLQSVAIRLTIDRENGILKRGRGTPMPTWVFFAGRVGNAIVISVLMLVIVSAIGRLVYAVSIPWDRLPAVLVTLAIGAASFCCLGVALTAAIPSEDAAPAITNVAVLPLYFLSGRLHSRDRDPRGRAPRREPVPDPPLLRGVLRRLRPGDGRRRVRVGAPRRRRRLGCARTRARDPLLPLDAAWQRLANAASRVGSIA